eukprot:scaffold7339_cov249-Pinguiococcus_pyrenoidosus.AAC.29
MNRALPACSSGISPQVSSRIGAYLSHQGPLRHRCSLTSSLPMGCVAEGRNCRDRAIVCGAKARHQRWDFD